MDKGLGYCVDCDDGAQLGGREALAACLSRYNNDKSKCAALHSYTNYCLSLATPLSHKLTSSPVQPNSIASLFLR